MPPELCIISQLTGLPAVNGLVVLDERSFEELSPESVQFCKSLADKSMAVLVSVLISGPSEDDSQLRISLFLTAYLHQH